jgi:hypothetical protein
MDFLVSIELIHNLEHAQIVFFFFYWPEFLKKLLVPETDEMCQFLGPDADPYLQFLAVSFWAQKLLKWVSKVSGPRN